MNFLLTIYLYPLSKPITLSYSLCITLDNPRTDEEIAYIEDYLKNSHENSPEPIFPVESDEEIVTLKWVLERFYDNCLVNDKQALRIYKKYRQENIYRQFARMWIVARYDDQGEFDRLKKIYKKIEEKGENGFVILDDDNPIEKAKKTSINYFSLLSLMCHTEPYQYYGRQILADNIISDMERHVPNRDLWQNHFTMFMIHVVNASRDTKEDSLNWTFFPKVKEKIITIAETIEKTLVEEGMENLLYIGSVLNIVSLSNSEDKVKILFLTSLLEFLLTHNPDYNRFNVEESINKQFQLKTSVVVYMHDKKLDINILKEKLRNIYNIRSCIAHGNFDKIDQMLIKLSKKNKEKAHMSSIVSELYEYIRAVIEVRFEDKEFIEFLKNG